MNKRGFIAVHAGAGQHSESLKDKYQTLCRDACKRGIETMRINGDVLEAVVEATIVMEDSALTNAGFGSNLTLEGKVECDASVMNGSTLHFGAVGAVSGVKNPVLLAKRLCQHQSTKIAYGLVPPSLLVGSGAHRWANEFGVGTCPPEDMISVKARHIYKHYKRKIEDHCNGATKISRRRLDTVGAVCVDQDGNVAAACSSGGIILKYPGRVGQAGVWGCGAWAQNGDYSVGTSTSGCGEHLIRTTLARTIAEAIRKSDCPTTSLHEAMKSEFIDSRFLLELDTKHGGVIAIRYSTEEGIGDLLWSHSTNSMIVGYMSSNDNTAKSHISRLPSQDVGKKACVEGICFQLGERDEAEKSENK